MTPKEVLGRLEALGSEKMRQQQRKYGARGNLFGVKMGDIRTLAKEIKTDHALALTLWDTENIDARFLSILILQPKKLSVADLERMLRSERFVYVVDWLYSYVIKSFPGIEAFREGWMDSDDIILARVGWNLTGGCVTRNPGVLDLPGLLDRIESQMADAPPEVQWTMNSTLANIGIRFPGYRGRALAIGEKLGIYRDYPVSKGCTSPFAPIWINEMVRRQTDASE